jgi:hypothetical protein
VLLAILLSRRAAQKHDGWPLPLPEFDLTGF